MNDKDFGIVADNFGWIKLSRKILQNDLWLKGEYDERSAWIYLLVSATYEKSEIYNPTSKSVIKLEPGQLLTSIKSLCEKWSWSYNKVSRYLDNLQSLGMITQNRTTKYTIISIMNWNKYQDVKPKKVATESEPQPQPQNEPPAEVNVDTDKPWDEMTPAEQAAYLRK